MRVERFFLFFGPTLWSFKRGETEYGIKAIPLGGYVKISGMNPEEEMPPEARAPRLLPAAGLEADRRRSPPGPAVNIVLAFAILFFVYFFNAQQADQKVGEVSGRDRRRRRCCSPATGSSPSTASASRARAAKRGSNGSASRSASHECAGKQVDGCVAATPVTLTDRAATARCGRSPSGPSTTRPTSAALVGFSYGSRADRRSAPDAPRPARSTRSGWSPRKPPRSSPASSKRSSASRSPGIVGVSDVANQTIDAAASRSRCCCWPWSASRWA